MEFKELLQARFDERDVLFMDSVELIKRSKFPKGDISGMIRDGHGVLISELNESAKVIIKTSKDMLIGSTSPKATLGLEGLAREELLARKFHVEELYRDKMRHVVDLENLMDGLKEYFNPDSQFGLIEKELIISMRLMCQDYTDSLGKTMFDRIKNQALNHPLTVLAVVIFSLVTSLGAVASSFDLFGC